MLCLLFNLLVLSYFPWILTSRLSTCVGDMAMGHWYLCSYRLTLTTVCQTRHTHIRICIHTSVCILALKNRRCCTLMCLYTGKLDNSMLISSLRTLFFPANHRQMCLYKKKVCYSKLIPTCTHAQWWNTKKNRQCKCLHVPKVIFSHCFGSAVEFTFTRYATWFQYNEVCMPRNASI